MSSLTHSSNREEDGLSEKDHTDKQVLGVFAKTCFLIAILKKPCQQKIASMAVYYEML